MKLNFNEANTTKQALPGGIVFTDYPNKSYTVVVDGVYHAVVYVVNFLDENEEPTTGLDTIYFTHKSGNYKVVRIHTHDGLEFSYG
jgi:hypothetical protein